jgi:hypothetical protein
LLSLFSQRQPVDFQLNPSFLNLSRQSLRTENYFSLWSGDNVEEVCFCLYNNSLIWWLQYYSCLNDTHVPVFQVHNMSGTEILTLFNTCPLHCCHLHYEKV